MDQQMIGNVILGQNFRFGFYDIPSDERIRAIKQAGFDSVMFWWGDEFESTDLPRYELYDLAEREGLSCTTVHFPSDHSDWLWYDDERGAEYEDRFINALSDCGEREIKHIVMHLTRRLITPPPNEIGADRFMRLLDKADKCGVTIAIENTRFLEYNRYILSHIDGGPVGFCYDSGHNNCYTSNEDPLGEFGSMLAATHLHDNDGKSDQHNPMGEGTVDFDLVFSRLASFGAKELNLESYCDEKCALFGRVDMDEYLSLSYNRLTKCALKNGL